MENKFKALIASFILVLISSLTRAQEIPSTDEKFPFLITFSKSADKKWGDDDFAQSIFFSIPENNKSEFYIRIFDPEVGGKHDEKKIVFNSKTKFSLYGGKGVHSDKAATTVEPLGNFKSGILMTSKVFDSDPKYDNNWYTFGPINPLEGELQPDNGGYIFKIVVEGIEGDDGNAYKFFLSKSKTENIPVEGGNSFCYEYSVRTNDNGNSICHVYPFLPGNIIACKVNIFDYDNEGRVRMVSVLKKGENFTGVSPDGGWGTDSVKIFKEELNTSMDIQFIKQKDLKNNNLVIFITNQYNEAIPFFSAPIGGVPKFKYKIDVNKIK
jgi:hypothetical protein